MRDKDGKASDAVLGCSIVILTLLVKIVYWCACGIVAWHFIVKYW